MGIPILLEQRYACSLFNQKIYGINSLYLAFSKHYMVIKSNGGPAYELLSIKALSNRLKWGEVKDARIVKYKDKSYNNRVKFREILV